MSVEKIYFRFPFFETELELLENSIIENLTSNASIILQIKNAQGVDKPGHKVSGFTLNFQ